MSRDGKSAGQKLSLVTLKGDFTLSGSTAGDMAELVTMFLSGLTERSQYAVSLRDGDSSGEAKKVTFTLCTTFLPTAFSLQQIPLNDQ